MEIHCRTPGLLAGAATSQAGGSPRATRSYVPAILDDRIRSMA